MAIRPIKKTVEAELEQAVCPHNVRLDAIETRLANLEDVFTDIGEVKEIAVKIWRAIKWGAPTVISAAATAGYINGDFGKLLGAIFN